MLIPASHRGTRRYSPSQPSCLFEVTIPSLDSGCGVRRSPIASLPPRHSGTACHHRPTSLSLPCLKYCTNGPHLHVGRRDGSLVFRAHAYTMRSRLLSQRGTQIAVTGLNLCSYILTIARDFTPERGNLSVGSAVQRYPVYANTLHIHIPRRGRCSCVVDNASMMLVRPW